MRAIVLIEFGPRRLVELEDDSRTLWDLRDCLDLRFPRSGDPEKGICSPYVTRGRRSAKLRS